MMSGASSSLSAQSPSFTSYSSQNLADIAARVVSELNLSHDDPYDDDFYSNDAFHDPQNDAVEDRNDDDDDEDEESEFEFAILCGEDNTSPISADEIFSNGQIKPMFPFFNTDLIYHNQDDDVVSNQNQSHPQTIRLPLRKLLQEQREIQNGVASCSSSEADDLEGIPQGTYCVWTPKKKEEMMMRKKSNSTGSNSKRWRFRDLLYRSNSDGKDTFVFLTPSNNHSNNNGDSKRREKKRGGGLEGKKKKKSYLPYRQDLVGFFANANGISRTVRPF